MIIKPNPGTTDDWKYTYYTYDANGQVMAMYDVDLSTALKKATLSEHHLYGASRLGMRKADRVLFNNGVVNYPTLDVQQHKAGIINYEITNYLGNVNAVITDRKTWNATGAYFEAVSLMKCDYYPFGMEMQGRKITTSNYRYGYNGMEKDDEVSGGGNSYDYGARQYNNRLGRWMSQDPLKAMYPSMSSYCYAGNSPIACYDPDGRLIIFVNGYIYGRSGKAGGPIIESGREYWYKPSEIEKLNEKNPNFLRDSEFIREAKLFFNDDRVLFVNGTGDADGSDFEDRYIDGVNYAYLSLYNQLALVGPDEEIEFVTHSMGAAFAEGMIDWIKYANPELASRIKIVVHLSAADAEDIIIANNTSNIERIQLNTTHDNTLFWADFWTSPKNRIIPGIDIFGLMAWNVWEQHPEYARCAEDPSKYDSHADTKWDPRVFTKWLPDLQCSSFQLKASTSSITSVFPTEITDFLKVTNGNGTWENTSIRKNEYENTSKPRF